MCFGDPHLELLDESGAKLALLSVHHGYGVRWDEAWSQDAALLDGQALLRWLAEHDYPQALAAFEKEAERAASSQRSYERWRAAMPPSLQGLPGDDLAELHAALSAAHPIPVDRARVLLVWYGSGEGPWSGYPAYESLAEELLLQTPTDAVVAALESGPPNDSLLEGGARYLAGPFRRHRRQEFASVPDALKQRLMEHVAGSSDRTNQATARSAFAPQPPAVWSPLPESVSDALRQTWGDAREELLARLVADGALPRANAELAAHLGDPGAVPFRAGSSRVTFEPMNSEDTLRGWVARIGWWGPQACMRAAVAAARLGLEVWEGTGQEPERAVAAAEAWVLCPCDDHARGAKDAWEACRGASFQQTAQDYVLGAARSAAWAAQAASVGGLPSVVVCVATALASVEAGTPDRAREFDPGLSGNDPSSPALRKAETRLRATISDEVLPWALGVSDPLRSRAGTR